MAGLEQQKHCSHCREEVTVTVITISRQYGSSGDEVAARVCKQLGYQYFDKRMIRQAVYGQHITADQLIDYHEDTYQMRSFFDRLRGYRPYPFPGGLSRGAPLFEGADEAAEQIGESMLVWLTAAAIRMAYEADDFVIIGRGGQAILQDMPGVLHVRIVAPLQQRARWVAEREKLSLYEARQVVSRHDEAAADYVKRYHGIDWAASRLYHLVLNAGWWPVEAAADLIEQAVKSVVAPPQGLVPT
jgi:cytidylate kinase